MLRTGQSVCSISCGRLVATLLIPFYLLLPLLHNILREIADTP